MAILYKPLVLGNLLVLPMIFECSRSLSAGTSVHAHVQIVSPMKRVFHLENIGLRSDGLLIRTILTRRGSWENAETLKRYTFDLFFIQSVNNSACGMYGTP